jgi:NhaP-type Na+/H+ or K+/H+ antiporter
MSGGPVVDEGNATTFQKLIALFIVVIAS